MTYRAALLVGFQKLELASLEDPVPADGEVLVQVRSVNVCQTDFKKWNDPVVTKNVAVAPVILGHEIAGEVVAVGPAVAEDLVGSRVAIDPILVCGECPGCLAGRPEACENLAGIGAAAGRIDRNAALLAERDIGGGFAELVKVPVRAIIPVPDEMSYPAASLVEPLADTMHSVRAVGTVAGRRCAVFGLGPMGLLHVQALCHFGAAVIGLDPVGDRRSLALQLGAEEANSPDDHELDPVDVAIVTAGGTALEPATRRAMELLSTSGTLVVFASGSAGSHLPIDLNALHYSRQRVVGVVGFERQDADRAIDALGAGAIDVEAIRSPSVSLEGLQRIFETMQSPEVMKPAIDY
jgi:threonine dehydrogenase-like Zn-dependent dehydrogenase